MLICTPISFNFALWCFYWLFLILGFQQARWRTLLYQWPTFCGGLYGSWDSHCLNSSWQPSEGSELLRVSQWYCKRWSPLCEDCCAQGLQQQSRLSAFRHPGGLWWCHCWWGRHHHSITGRRDGTELRHRPCRHRRVSCIGERDSYSPVRREQWAI